MVSERQEFTRNYFCNETLPEISRRFFELGANIDK